MSRHYAYTQQEKVLATQRVHGEMLADKDWESGHREPLRLRDAGAWDALTACERTGYGRQWQRLDFKFRQTFCVAHRLPEDCGYCIKARREATEAQPVELTRERVLAAEGSW